MENMLAWQFKMGRDNCLYLHMTIYRKEEILPRLQKIEFTHPPSLEFRLALKGDKNIVGLIVFLAAYFFANTSSDGQKKEVSFEKQITHDLGKVKNKFNRMLILIGTTGAFNLLLMGFSIKCMVRKI